MTTVQTPVQTTVQATVQAMVQTVTPFEVVDLYVHGDTASIEDMTHAERLEFTVLLEAQRGWLDATQARVLAYEAEHPEPLPVASCHSQPGEFLRDEYALALGWSFGMTHDRITVAHTLVALLPATLRAVEHDGLGYYKAAHLARAVRDCDPTVAARIEARVLPRAVEQNLPTFQKAVARAVLALDPADRHAAAAKTRAVTARPVEDGMGLIQALVPAADMVTIMSAVQAIADGYLPDPADQRTADQRSADQRRADALTDLCAAALSNDIPSLTCGKRHGRPVTLEVTISLTALLGLSGEPGELAGYGPVPAEVVRALGFDDTARWRTVITTDAGYLLDYGRSTYTPPQALKDYLIARDRTCTVPGCQRSARTCDIDHLQDWNHGGVTSATNNHPLCPHHHKMKHDSGWTIHRLDDGTYVWTAPTGRVHVKPPTELPH